MIILGSGFNILIRVNKPIVFFIKAIVILRMFFNLYFMSPFCIQLYIYRKGLSATGILTSKNLFQIIN